MSMRIKTAIVIILIVFAITAASYVSSLLFTTKNIVSTMENDQALLRNIADNLIGTKIELMKSNASGTVQKLLDARSGEEWPDIMKAQLDEFSDFIAFAVFSRDGVKAGFGNSPARDGMGAHSYLSAAFDGKSGISTSHIDPFTGELVFYLYLPMSGDLVFAATIPGMYFSDILSEYRLWDTGSIYLVDGEGTFIAHYDHSWVQNRINYIELAKTDPIRRSAGAFFERILSESENGDYTGTFIDDQKRLFSYKRISSSAADWVIAVVVPLSESPKSDVERGLLYAALFFLAIGVVIAIFVSGFVARPLYKIEAQNRNLEQFMSGIARRDNLLNTVNNAATILLSTDEDDNKFLDSLLSGMKLVGQSMDVDRVQIWQNEVIDGELHFVHKYEWLSDFARRKKSVGINLKFPYSARPGWEDMFLRGEHINGPVFELSQSEQDFLSPYNIKSIVIIPLFLQEKFWGFFSLDDCHRERTFTEEEIDILRSASLMMASAVNRYKQTAKIRDAHEQMKTLLDAMPFSCILWNRDANVFACNEENVRLFGLRNKQEFMDHVSDFSPEYQPDGSLSSEKCEYFIKKAFEDGRCVTEWMYQKPDGTLIPAETTLVRVAHDGDYAVAEYMRDLREHKKMMNAIERRDHLLREALNEAKDANDAKSNFLARMSHEIRTPLNVIIGLSELTLEIGGLNEEVHANLEKIYNSGAMLLNIVNDILDISKIEAGKLTLIPVEYDIPSLINDTVTQSIMRLEDKPVEFILDIDETLPTRLYGDDLRVKQIFNNLLSNAMKYTRQGTVEFGVRCERDESLTDTVWMTVSVRDTGIGIRPEDINRLFNNYIKVDTRYNRAIEGTGLGLAITKMLVELMDGSVTVESEYGKGSTFTARFRQKFIDDTVIGPEIVKNLKNLRYADSKRAWHSQLVRIRLPYARVLLVDDNATNLDVAKGMMHPYGMQIDCVSGGQQAVDAVRNEKIRYNAIFMDHMMPGMDGIEAVRIIREEIGTEYAKTVPIIALTANAVIGNKEMFLSKGFQAFISKPIEMTHLDAVIRQWVRDKEQKSLFDDQRVDTNDEAFIERLGGDKRRPVPDRKNSVGRCVPGMKEISGLNMNEGIARFGGDEKTYQQILQSYVTNTRLIFETIKEINEDSLDDYLFAVHGIKASSRGIGAEAIGARAEALEKMARARDIGSVRAAHQSFLVAVEELMLAIEDMLSEIAADKPIKDKPCMEILSRIRVACKNYDIDGLDTAMADLEVCEYESDGELVAWLRENVDRMNYEEIIERLSPVAGTENAG